MWKQLAWAVLVEGTRRRFKYALVGEVLDLAVPAPQKRDMEKAPASLQDIDLK